MVAHPGRANHNQLNMELIMTTHECTTNPVVLKNPTYLYPVNSSPKPLYINEEDEDYSSKPLNKAAHRHRKPKALYPATTGHPQRQSLPTHHSTL